MTTGPVPRLKERAKGGFTTRARSQSRESAVLSMLRPGASGEGAGEGSPGKNGASGNGGGVATKGDELNGHTDIADIHRTLNGEVSCGLRRRSRSYEDMLTAEEPDFCLLSYTEPDESETGGAYDIIFDDCEYLSDEDVADDHSTEVRDLTPMDSSYLIAEGVDGSRVTGTVTLPRASTVLINAFQQRIESVMVNGVHYPPGLFFVQ